MKYADFEMLISQERLSRYIIACNGNQQKTMLLYRQNIRLAQASFAVVSYFEIALRNKIDDILRTSLGNDWLRDAVQAGGIFDNNGCRKTRDIIERAYLRLQSTGTYSHSKLLAEMEFGIWKYMFNAPHYRATGQVLLRVFCQRPRSSQQSQYNNTYFFNELDKVNMLRNRIAHHEQICFTHQSQGIDTSYIRNEYSKIQDLFLWMGIDARDFLYGLDHVSRVCDEIDSIDINAH